MSKKATTRITAYPRLHLGLHDCGNTTNRLFGGVGVAIKGLPTVVELTRSETTSDSVTFVNTSTSSKRTEDEVRDLLERLRPELESCYDIRILMSAPEHTGLGSKTSLLLAITYGALVTDASALRSDMSQVVALTRRGGTSGVGINTFWQGGLVADGGHASFGARNFAPSSARTPGGVAPIVSRTLMPEEWRVSIFYDPRHIPIHAKAEKEYFAKLMPIPDLENLRAIAATYHGILPAILEQDIVRLASALYDMNHTGMKQYEVAMQTDATKRFLTQAWQAGYAAGLSSFGAAVYVIARDDSDDHAAVASLAQTEGMVALGTFEFDNEGVQVVQP